MADTLIPEIRVVSYPSGMKPDHITVEIYPDTHHDRHPAPTKEQLEALPAQFRCYLCQRKLPKHRFGGMIHGQWVCWSCARGTDEMDVGGVIKFDIRHQFPIPEHVEQATQG